MNEFMQAVQDGDFMAAKQAFEYEMSTRTRGAIEATRREIAANAAPFEEDDE
ncbi:hypothetical protein AHP1_2681 [Aeromonas phage Ahp1_CNU-2021]|nr:hypothetical protein AHP1_2681 [Aeromonas phage Ahp1_CNU-2021]